MKERVMSVLLIEDNEGDIELTKIAFKKAGISCNLMVARDGEEGIDYLHKRGKFRDVITPDFVMVDLNMPRMGGKEFLDAVKQNDRLKTIPVIMFTSSQAPAEILECYRRHANCYILKPSSLEEFISVAKHLESFWSEVVQLPE